MDKELSSKIKIISFISIVAVVFLHAYNWSDNFLLPTTVIYEGLYLSTFTEFFISNGLTRFAVPVFFMISGYLFYLTFEFSKKGYWYKLKSRFKSLVIPYIAWVIIGVAVFVIIAKCGKFDEYFPYEYRSLSVGKWIYFELYNFQNILFQFWFVRELLKYLVVSPLIYIIIKKTKLWILIPVAIAWATGFSNDKIESIVNIEAILFYSIGSYLAIHKKKNIIEYKIDGRIILLTAIAWIGVFAYKTYLASIMYSTDNVMILSALHKIGIILGIITVWYGYRFVFRSEKVINKWTKLSRDTFFIFAFHIPIISYLQDILYMSKWELTKNLIFYFVTTTLVIIVAIILSELLLKFLPKVHAVLTGGRGTTRRFQAD